MQAQSCENCRFFRELSDREKRLAENERQGDPDLVPATGTCRRHAPPVVVGDRNGPLLSWAWPPVELDNWCGEWEETLRHVPGGVVYVDRLPFSDV